MKNVTNVARHRRSTLSYARQYVDRGLSVIPIEPRGKRPAIASWKVYQERQPTDEELLQWFDGTENNIAIVTGRVSNVAVIDLDSEDAVKFAQAHDFTDTATVKTARGLHLYCRYSEGENVRNFQKRDDLPDIDLRGEGGYVVAPPSVHESGIRYHWDRGLDTPLLPLPDRVLQRTVDGRQRISELYAGVEQGRRNDSLTRLAGSWVRDGLALEECLENARIWNTHNEEPLSDEEMERTVRSIFDAHRRTLIHVHEHETLDSPEAVIDPSTFNPDEVLQAGSDLAQLDVHIEYAIDKILPERSVTLFYGAGGIGKTWLSLAIARSVSEGRPFMGWDTKRMPVYYIDYENPLPMLVDRVRKIRANEVRFWHSSSTLNPPQLDGRNWALLSRLERGLIIIDTLRASQNKEENNSLDMRLIMTRLKKIRDQGFTILLLHHTPKNQLRMYKGSTAISDLADHVLSLHTTDGKKGQAVDDGLFAKRYRFGTQDKTRYEPFHIYLEFSKEQGFIPTPDPQADLLESIAGIIGKKEQANQGQLFEAAKEELGIKDKERFLGLLRKGQGIYWESVKAIRGKAILYRLIVDDAKKNDNATMQSGNVISIPSKTKPIIERYRRRNIAAGSNEE